VALTAIVLPGNRSVYAALTLGLGAVITWLELYPFHFRVPASGLGALHTLLKSWADRPPLGDFIRMSSRIFRSVFAGLWPSAIPGLGRAGF
jgi:hypothetical protein